MPRPKIPNELLTERQKRDRKYRENNKKYYQNYSKYNYLKNILADPNYNKKNNLKRKLKLIKNKEQNKENQQ